MHRSLAAATPNFFCPLPGGHARYPRLACVLPPKPCASKAPRPPPPPTRSSCAKDRPGDSAPGAGAAAPAPAGGRSCSHHHGHQRVCDPPHRPGAGRGRTAGHRAGARHQRLVYRQRAGRAQHARRQSAPHGAVAGPAPVGLGRCAQHVLQRLHQRHSLLEKAKTPGNFTNPDARLRELAVQRGWRILDLFSATP